MKLDLYSSWEHSRRQLGIMSGGHSVVSNRCIGHHNQTTAIVYLMLSQLYIVLFLIV